MTIKTLSVCGLRGFSVEQSLRFAQPTRQVGSGLTILVGPNSGGKSTIVETLHAFATNNPTFSVGKRNERAESRVSIRVESADGSKQEIQTVKSGGSEIIRTPQDSRAPENWYILPSRRFFTPYFGRSRYDRRSYILQSEVPNTRSAEQHSFFARLFSALENIEAFNEVLSRVMDPVPNWTIDQSDEGRYFINVNSAGQHHNSDGLGEGVVSLLFLIDALYDSSPGDVVVVDEPELSLHPIYQRRILSLFAEYAKDRQIIYATHSPYFVDFLHILNGAQVARIFKSYGASRISQISEETVVDVRGIEKNLNNPHVLGLTARETFFQEDGVIVVEGQEDVVFFGLLVDQLKGTGRFHDLDFARLRERFFGWGAGGAGNIRKILLILSDLGFRRVAAILDNNEAHRIDCLQKRFPIYHFVSIPADDIRTGRSQTVRPSVCGLLDEKNRLRDEFAEQTERIVGSVANYILSESTTVAGNGCAGGKAP